MSALKIASLVARLPEWVRHDTPAGWEPGEGAR